LTQNDLLLISRFRVLLLDETPKIPGALSNRNVDIDGLGRQVF
jgi:hypothetical protein